MGILANNEWREGYLDEGFTSFQTGWVFETHGYGAGDPGVEPDILLWDLDRWSEPVSMVSERYRDFFTYNTMIYEKGQLFYEQLRYVVGDDVMRQILRTYYARWRLKHVDEDAFRSVAEAVSHQDLKWLFGQWLHGTPLIDYKFGKVRRKKLPDGRWRTTAVIDRVGDGWMPIEVAIGDSIAMRISGQAEHETVEFITPKKPKRLVPDPRHRGPDRNALNNYGGSGRGLRRFDDMKTVARRDRVVGSWLPLAWSNDFGGATVGMRVRTNYLDRFDKNLMMMSYALDPHYPADATKRFGLYMRLGNPASHPVARTDVWAAGWSLEGRSGAAIHTDRSLRKHLGFGPDVPADGAHRHPDGGAHRRLRGSPPVGQRGDHRAGAVVVEGEREGQSDLALQRPCERRRAVSQSGRGNPVEEPIRFRGIRPRHRGSERAHARPRRPALLRLLRGRHQQPAAAATAHHAGRRRSVHDVPESAGA